MRQFDFSRHVFQAFILFAVHPAQVSHDLMLPLFGDVVGNLLNAPLETEKPIGKMLSSFLGSVENNCTYPFLFDLESNWINAEICVVNINCPIIQSAFLQAIRNCIDNVYSSILEFVIISYSRYCDACRARMLCCYCLEAESLFKFLRRQIVPSK